MKVSVQIITLFIVVGCSGGSDGLTPECGANSSCAQVSLSPDSSVVGLWDRSGMQNSRLDVLFTYIGEDGEYLVYDFEQDDFGSGLNCHTLDTGSIFRVTESSNYTIQFVTSESDSEGVSNSFVTIFRQGENLQVSSGDVTRLWRPVVDITTDDLELCQ